MLSLLELLDLIHGDSRKEPQHAELFHMPPHVDETP